MRTVLTSLWSERLTKIVATIGTYRRGPMKSFGPAGNITIA